MIKLIHKYALILFASLLSSQTVLADKFISSACRAINTEGADILPAGEFKHGLLWEVSKPGIAPNYVFGTIHVANDDIEAKLTTVKQRLKSSKTFVMEALPDPHQIRQLQMMMFYIESDLHLYDHVPKEIYQRTLEILSAYHLPEDVVSKLRPWGAYLNMSYPPNLNKILDQQLFELAVESGAKLNGLETMVELGEVFTAYTAQEQAQFLIDSVCHYDLVERDFKKLVELYLAGDLEGIYLYSQRYSYDDNSLYEDLAKRLLNDRNIKMVDRMQPWLQQGSTFVAVGALHLPGEDGVLASLKKLGYKIRLVE